MDLSLFKLILLTLASWSTSGLDFSINLRQSYRHTLKNYSYVKGTVKITPGTYRFIMVQAISQVNKISLSYSGTATYAQFRNSTSAGLVYMLKGQEDNIHFYLAASKIPTYVQIQAVPYAWKDPLPGGCCTTCSFDNDPNIVITEKSPQMELVFPRANIFHNHGSQPAICDGVRFSTYRLEYDLHTYQLMENDLTEEGLFNAIWKMSSASKVKFHGTKVGTISGSHKVKFLLQSLPYQGTVFNIIVRDPTTSTESAYSPVFDYGCDISNKASCKSQGTVTTIVYASMICVFGFVLCLFGHKIISFELFIGGCITGFVIAYILLLRFANLQYLHRVLNSTAVGIIIGLLLLLLWTKTNYCYICMVNNNVLIGILFSCCIMFSSIGQEEAFNSNLVYIATVLCIAMAFPIPLVFFPKFGSITFSALYGSFGVVLGCSVLIHAKLQYIIIEFILRCGIPSFADAYLRVPFQRNDYFLCAAWAVMFLIGFSFQSFITRKEKFPPPHKCRKGNKKTSRRALRNGQQAASERTPLLQGENIHYGVVLEPSNRRGDVV